MPKYKQTRVFLSGKKRRSVPAEAAIQKKYKMFCNNINKGLGRDDAMIIR